MAPRSKVLQQRTGCAWHPTGYWLVLATLRLEGLLDRRVVLGNQPLVVVYPLCDAFALEALINEFLVHRNRSEVYSPVVRLQLLERYSRLVWTHGLALCLFSRNLDLRLIYTVVLVALSAYPIEDVEQRFLLRAVCEVGTSRVEVLARARPVERYYRWLRDAFLIIP